MSYKGQTRRYLTQRYREHIQCIRNNDPQSTYAQHILRNQFEYGTTTDMMTLLKPIHTTAMLIPYEQLFIQTFHYNGNLITEQSRGEQNPLFQLAIDTGLTSQPSLTDEYLLRDAHESVATQQREQMVADPSM